MENKSIVANTFKDKKENKKETKADDMFTMTYEEAKEKYAQGQGNNKYFMPKAEFEKAKAEKAKAEKAKATSQESTSLVANKFGAKKGKTWADVKNENENDPTKIANYLNNTSDYKAGDLTKKGMAEFGYKQDENGKWVANANEQPTVDTVLDELDKISAEDQTIAKTVDSLTNPETGEVDEGKANEAISKYEKALIDLGAAYYDEDGKFTLKPTSSQKGWETWATLLSVGLSVVGIALGVPIIPINFRAVTGKDAREAQIQALQQQYVNIKADSAGTIDKMNADVGAGEIALNNQKALEAQEKHSQATGATKDVIKAQTGAEKELIETRTDAEIKRDEEQFKRDMKRLQSDQNFQLKLAALQQQYAKEMANLNSALSTGSAIQVMRYQNSGFLKDMADMGMSFSDIASYMAAKNGISPADKNWNRVKLASDMVDGKINALKQ
jgi:hypothetical protein